jgi:hypothetical protein
MTAAWVGWTTDAAKARTEARVSLLGMSTTALDIMSNPAPYSSKLHYGEEGERALCGVQIPRANPDAADPCLWWGVGDLDECKSCRAALAAACAEAT